MTNYILYYGKHWKISKIREPIREHEFWIGAFITKYGKISIVIIAVSRSPSVQKAEFCEALNEFLDTVCEENYEIVIAGDFNIDWYKDYYRTRLVNILNDNGLKQIVNAFTRIIQSSKTLVDYIYLD